MKALNDSEIDVYHAIEGEYNKYKEKESDLTLRTLKTKIAITKILSFSYRRFIRKGKNVNRIFNSFTNLSKVSRSCIKLDGNSFTEIDIPNCQPLLLLVLLSKYKIIPDEKYKNDVLNGCVYELLMEKAAELGIRKELISSFNKKNYTRKTEEFDFTKRKHVKVLSYRSIFFCLKNEGKSPTARVFKELYPIVFDALKNNPNLNDEHNLAFHLQNLEAEVILNIIPNCPYYTVHDSIAVINQEEVEVVKNKLQKKIGEYLNMEVNLNLESVSLINETEKAMNEKAESNRILTCPIRIQGKTQNRKQLNYDKFKLICDKYTRAETTVELNISSKTYLRYLEEYKQEQVVQIA